MEMYELLWAEFDEVGWELYDGVRLNYPANTYYLLWIVASLFSIGLIILKRNSSKEFVSQIDSTLSGFALFFLFSYILLYFSDGSISVKESKWGWTFTAGLQILLSIFLLFDKSLLNIIDTQLKWLFLLNTFVYIGLFFLGKYFLEMDNAILMELALVGWDVYDGMDRDEPENIYHIILIFSTVISLLITMWTKDKTVVLSTYKGLLTVFFLYAVFVYINDGNPNMKETFYWWGSLCVCSTIVSLILFIITKDKLPTRPEYEKFYDNDILDDFSSLK